MEDGPVPHDGAALNALLRSLVETITSAPRGRAGEGGPAPASAPAATAASPDLDHVAEQVAARLEGRLRGLVQEEVQRVLETQALATPPGVSSRSGAPLGHPPALDGRGGWNLPDVVSAAVPEAGPRATYDLFYPAEPDGIASVPVEPHRPLGQVAGLFAKDES